MSNKKHNPDISPVRPRKGRKALACLIVAGLLCVAAFAGLRYALTTENGSRTLWQAVTWVMGDALRGEFAGGTWSQGVRLHNLHYEDATTTVEIDTLRSHWSLFIGKRLLEVPLVEAGNIVVTLRPDPDPTPSEPATMPGNLTLPLSVNASKISFSRLTIINDDSGEEQYFSDLMLRATSDRHHHAVLLDRLQAPFGQLSGQAHLDDTLPYSVSGHTELQGQYDGRDYRIRTDLSGSLDKFDVDLVASGMDVNGTIHAKITPFSGVPFQSAEVDIQNFTPRIFSPTAPQAKFVIRAQLTPSQELSSTAPDEPGRFVVGGSIDITNLRPGTIDAGYIPLSSARATLSLDARTQHLSGLDIRLGNDTRLSGEGTLHRNSNNQQTGTFKLVSHSLNLHELHTHMRPSALKGPLSVDMIAGTTTISMQLQDKTTRAHIDTIITPRDVILRSFDLKARDATIQLAGNMALDGSLPYALTGTLRNVDPGIWMTNAPQGETGINLDLQANGAVTPLAAHVNFTVLDNSRYADLPMEGKGKLHINGMHLLPSTLHLAIAGNTFDLDGSFGQKNDTMHVKVNAPHLTRIGHGLAGQLQLDGVLSGTPATPALKASYSASKLRFFSHAIDSLNGAADISTNLDSTADIAAARLNVKADLKHYTGPNIRLDALQVNLTGTGAGHQLSLQTEGNIGGQQLHIATSARGKLLPLKDSYGWQGTLETLENKYTSDAARSLPLIRLLAPLPLKLAPDDLDIGHLRMQFGQTRLDIPYLRYQDGVISSKGQVDDLNLDGLQAILEGVTDAQIPLLTTLVLDADWDLQLGSTASGHLQIARKSGDIHIRNSETTTMALGVSALSWRASLDNTSVTINGDVRSDKIGTMQLASRTSLHPREGLLTIMPYSSVDGTVKMSIPDLQKSGELIGPQVRLGGKFDMGLKLTGTVESPLSSGHVNGDDISFILLDQGIQLNRGTIRLLLDKNIMDLQQFTFHGGEGTLNATGKVNLGKTVGNLQASVNADRLQIFAAPDRQLQLSGQAVLSNVGGQMQVNGDIHVLNALFEMPKSSAPTLGDDVVIVRHDKKHRKEEEEDSANTAQSGSIIPAIFVKMDFGSNFRFRGAGADLRLSGAIDLKREHLSPLRSSGTIDAAGTYETLGAKLEIERGQVNFAGPIENPDINIKAMRRNQEVAAGVEVTGTVRRPRVKLVSEPEVSDEEKLSWMVLGRSQDTSNTSEVFATAQALSILGNYTGKFIAQEIGVDQFSIRNGEAGMGETQVVNIGKFINRKIMVGAEMAMNGSYNVANLTWNISRRWEVVARGGTVNGLNVLFNVRYD